MAFSFISPCIGGFPGLRYVILVISILMLTIVGANMLAFNFTIICMFKEDSTETANRTVLYTHTDHSWFVSAVAFGNLIGILPLITFAHGWDTRWVFTFYGLVSGISMLLMPLAVSVHFAFVFVLRMMQGFGTSVTFTSIGSIVNSWSPLKSVGMYISLLTTWIQLSPLLAFPVSGALCTSTLGWQSVYYLFGGLTVVVFVIFALLYRDAASQHPCIRSTEVSTILEERVPLSDQNPHVPYKALFSDLVIWGAIASLFAVTIGVQFMVQYGPSYLNKVLGVDIKGTAVAAALPYLLALGAKFVIGPVSDSVTCVSERTKIIIFNTVAQLPICICFIIMAAVPKSMNWLAQLVYSLVSMFSAFNTVGVFKCIQLVARQHANIIMGLMGLTTSAVMLLLPTLVEAIATDYTRQQWALILYLLSGIIAVMIVFFNIVCRTEPRHWTISDDTNPTELTYMNHKDNEVRSPFLQQSTAEEILLN
uniref:MFS domain-containing protein n=1 Tax=Panagrellus redivivus TaxID=6233 RepID=A0A7E4W2V0_PANRE